METPNNINYNDDELLTQFFADHKPQPADNGFSAGVMRRLPQRKRRMNQIWSALCAAMAVALFLVFDGVDQLRELFWRFLGDVAGYMASFDLSNVSPVMMALAALVLLVIGVGSQLSSR